MNRYALSRMCYLGTSGVHGPSVGQDGDDFRHSRFCTNLVSRVMEGGRAFSAYSPSDVVTDASLGPGDSLFLCSVLANIFGCLATTILFNSTKWCKKDGNWYHILKTPLRWFGGCSPKRQNNIYSFHCFDYPCFFSFSRLDFAGDLFVLFRTLDLWVLCFRCSWDNLSIYSNHVFLLTRNLHYINCTNKHSWPKQ